LLGSREGYITGAAHISKVKHDRKHV
jgi:hypothetical protein